MKFYCRKFMGDGQCIVNERFDALLEHRFRETLRVQVHFRG